MLVRLMPYQKSLFGALALSITLASPAMAGNRCEALFEPPARALPVRTFEASETLSQKIRDNAPDYWKYVQVNGASYFGKLADYHGIVVGDTHPGNFIMSPLGGKMRFFIADIKDSGDAPLIYDFARLVLASHAVLKGEVKLQETADLMQSAYAAGLAGANFETPKEIQWIFKSSLKEFEATQREYVEGKVENDGFKFKKGTLEKIDFIKSSPERFEKLKHDINQIVTQTLGTDAQVLDYAFRPRERGGSVEMTRYWALVRKDGELSIFEFKQVSEPATSQIRAQEDTIPRYNRIFDTFWQIRDPNYQIIPLDGDFYLMRPKKTDVYRVPYKMESKKDRDFTLGLAQYDAYYLGQIHGRQLRDSKYLDHVASEREELNRVLRTFVKDYVDHIEEAVEKVSGK